MVRVIVCAVTLSLLCLAAPIVRAADQAADESFAPLQGTWKVVRFTVEGKVAKDRQIDASLLTFSGDQLFMKPGDGSQSERFTMLAEPDSKPAAIHVTRTEPAGRPQSGWEIYEVKGDRLRLAFFDALKGRPTSFDPLPKLMVLELERVSEGAPEPDTE